MRYITLSAQELKQYLKKHLLTQLAPFGFTKLYSRGDGTFIERKTKQGYDHLGLSIYQSVKNNEVGQEMGCGVSKRIDSIENILIPLSNKIKLNPPPSRDSFTVATSKRRYHNMSGNERSAPMINEEDVIRECQPIVNYMLTEGIPFLDKMSDIGEIDAEINNLDNFWVDDFNARFSLGGNFSIKRLIIAKLAGNPHFDEVVKRNYDSIDQILEKQGDTVRVNRTDTTFSIPYTVEYLRSLPVTLLETQ